MSPVSPQTCQKILGWTSCSARGPGLTQTLSQQHPQGTKQVEGVCLTVHLALSHAACRHQAAWLLLLGYLHTPETLLVEKKNN